MMEDIKLRFRETNFRSIIKGLGWRALATITTMLLVFMFTGNPKPSNKIDAEVLDAINAWRGLPIARRYFRNLPKKPFERTLKELIKQQVLREYPPLVEISGAHVGWKEHTVHLGPNGPEVLTA